MMIATLRRPNRGFTLLELMVAIAVVGVLVAVGVPAYSSFVLGQRIKSASFELVATLSFARSEAIKQNCSITITPTTAGDWSSGWSVSSAGGCAAAETLKTQDAYRNLTFTGPAAITYSGNGRASSGTGTIQIAATSASAGVQSRCISVGLTGQPTVKQGSCS